jgi:aminopeptidase N
MAIAASGYVKYQVPTQHAALYERRRTSRPASRDVGTPVPAELKRLVRLATEAVNARDSDALRPFAAPDALSTFAWIRGKTTKLWAGDVLVVPTLPPAAAQSDAAQNQTNASPPLTPYLAVFHAWHTCESDGDHIHRIEQTPDGWRLGAEIPETETGGYRVRDHDLHVTLDIAKQSASIHDQVKIEVAPDPTLPVCLLRLSEDFHVTGLKAGGAIRPFVQVGGVIALLPTITPTHTFTIEMAYEGRVSHQGSDYILPREATLDSYWYPHIARLPAKTTVTAIAPPGWTAIAQGEKTQERRDAEGATTVTYRNEIPNSFFTLDVGRYTITRRTVNGRVLSALLLTPDEARARRSLDLLEASLAYFDRNFAPFPYTHYEVVETKGPFGGALEAYSFATFQSGTLPGTVTHELAHTWWGGLVPCAYTRSMWNESFAEYSSGLFGRMNRQAGALLEAESAPPRGKRPDFGAAFDAFTLEEAGDTSDGRQSSVGYGKGGLVMRVLEEEIGQPAMLRCLQSFVKDHPRGEAAEWPDFARVVNKVTGQDYDWFFAQWMRRKGLPHVRLENVRSGREGNGFVVQGDIVQDGEPYRLHLPLRLDTQNGQAIKQTLEVAGPRTAFQIQSMSAPARVTLDPANVLPLAMTAEQGTAAF